jgi:hypothetical protein
MVENLVESQLRAKDTTLGFMFWMNSYEMWGSENLYRVPFSRLTMRHCSFASQAVIYIMYTYRICGGCGHLVGLPVINVLLLRGLINEPGDLEADLPDLPLTLLPLHEGIQILTLLVAVLPNITYTTNCISHGPNTRICASYSSPRSSGRCSPSCCQRSNPVRCTAKSGTGPKIIDSASLSL